MMDYREALESLRYEVYEEGHCSYIERELDAAIDALAKQVPQKPIGTHTDYKCSVCGRRVRSGKGSSSHVRDNFCQRCGQKQDWEGCQ
jgi:DNA-directed RNA polymerase subunit RPC12/RpoP